MSTTTLWNPPRTAGAPLFRRLPVISHFSKSVGLQRGMLVAGLVLTGVFLLTAMFAPLLAPYGYCPALRRRRQLPGPAATRRQAPAGAPRWAATTSCPG